MKKQYIQPMINVMEVDITEVVCTSPYQQGTSGPNSGDGWEFDAPGSRRNSGWDDYENR